MANVRELQESLRCGKPGCPCMRGKLVHCPAHPDHHPSLSVTEKDGRVLVHCLAGCPQETVLEALRARGLWGTRARERQAGRAARRETRYEVRDPEGRLVAVHVRVDGPDGKRFRWESPDGTPGLRGMRVQDLPLYNVDKVRAADEVILVEGEKAAEALCAVGLAAVGTVTGASTAPSHEALRPLASRRVYLWPDADEPGRAHMLQIAARLAALGCGQLFILEWPDAPPGGDAADLVVQHGENARDAVLELLRQARPYTTEPQPELGRLLDEVARFISSYVVCASWQADLLALWVAHTWAIDAADVTPYIHVTSAEKRSGKTRLLEVLECVVARPWCTANASVAAIARRVAMDQPTLLLDEADATFADRERAEMIRGILNSGYRRGGQYSRVVGEGAKARVVDFETFGAKAFAGIGKLPDTITDRSLVVELKRRRPDEQVGRFRLRTAVAEAAPLREALRSWADSAVPVLRAANPEVPEELDDRAAEISEPLLAIADLAGSAWAARAREAVVAACKGRAVQEESVGVRTLAGVVELFRERGVDRLSTEELLRGLVEREDGPWAEWWSSDLERGNTRRPAMRLARLLAPFGGRPTKFRTSDGVAVRGYLWEDLVDAVARYVPAPPEEVGTTEQKAETRATFALQLFRPALDEPPGRNAWKPRPERIVPTFRPVPTSGREQTGAHSCPAPDPDPGPGPEAAQVLLAPQAPGTCVDCGAPLPPGNLVRCGPCLARAWGESWDEPPPLKRQRGPALPESSGPGSGPEPEGLEKVPPALEVDILEGADLLALQREEDVPPEPEPPPPDLHLLPPSPDAILGPIPPSRSAAPHGGRRRRVFVGARTS